MFDFAWAIHPKHWFGRKVLPGFACIYLWADSTLNSQAFVIVKKKRTLL